ncbi:unnamed protein product [Euphydryas editha]|uniref:Uncharacterized protein n=1 Tax=Euphydryas editha TaxID=104508 RepID=A0AAU9TC14_EUPED|nr:unnamed protein product [Euphydryas editha]
MAERGKHRVAPVPAPTKKQYAYVPCPRSEEVGTEFALQLLRSHHQEPPTPEKQPASLKIKIETDTERLCGGIVMRRSADIYLNLYKTFVIFATKDLTLEA